MDPLPGEMHSGEAPERDLELEDVQLSPPPTPAPRAAADDDDAPGRRASPPAFQFPTAAQAAAYEATAALDTLTLADAAGAFESLPLGRGPGGSAQGWDARRRSTSDEPDTGTRTGTGHDDEGHDEAEPTPTPPLSESTSSAAPTAASSKTTLPPETESGSSLEQGPPEPIKDVERPAKNAFVQQPSRGPSLLQKTISMTRQRDLPPKDREQERKHLRELEEMLAASKEAERRRRANLESATAARAAVLASALPAWETSILPNWRVVLHEDLAGKALRKLWWDGTMPVRWRGRLWGLCVGNGLAVSRNAYATSLARAKKGQAEGRYPEQEWTALLEDVEMTLPTLKLFHREGGVMHDELVDVLLAYTVYWGGQPRYPRGLSYSAAMLLVNMPAVDAFLTLINLVNKSFLKSFFSDSPEEVDAYYRIFDTLLADTMPKVYANFSHEVVRPKLYLQPWLTSTFVRLLPLDLATRIFDVFLLEGDSFLFRVALVVLQILEPRLFNPVLAELDAVFQGEDRGAVLVVRRDKDLPDGAPVEVEDVYTEMGCSEEAIFSRLEKLDWKEETWDRLVARELPEAD